MLLPGPGAAQEGHVLARPDLEVDVGEDRPSVVVGEADVLEADAARDRRQGPGVRGVLHVGLDVEHLEDPLEPGAGGGDLRQVLADALDRGCRGP